MSRLKGHDRHVGASSDSFERESKVVAAVLEKSAAPRDNRSPGVAPANRAASAVKCDRSK